MKSKSRKPLTEADIRMAPPEYGRSPEAGSANSGRHSRETGIHFNRVRNPFSAVLRFPVPAPETYRRTAFRIRSPS